jgi:hypothetical protein
VLSEEEYITIRAKSERHTWAHLQPIVGVLVCNFTKGDLRILLEAAKSGKASEKLREREIGREGGRGGERKRELQNQSHVGTLTAHSGCVTSQRVT